MISVVIPALNASRRLQRTLVSLEEGSAAGIVEEVIVVDGASNDGTEDIANNAGATVVCATRGRGRQLAAGAQAARSLWLLFLHADTALEAGWAHAVNAFASEPQNQRRAAYFRFRLDAALLRARVVEAGAALRCRLFALPFGDQGLLISRDLYDAIGGFAPLPLMEDVDMVRRIGRARLKRLPAAAITSAVRYDADGYFRRVVRNTLCLMRYFAGVSPERLAAAYEKRRARPQ